MSGWIKLHRELKDWEWYQKPNHAFLFMHLLMKANHKAGKWQGVQIEAGQLITGRKVLASETGIGEQSVRTILNNLKSTNEITIKTTSKFSIISIVNWTNYQSDNQQTNQDLTNGQPTTNQRPTTNKNEKKNKKEKKESFAPIFTEVIDHLNKTTGKEFKVSTKKHQEFITARINSDKATLEEFKAVINTKSKQWLNDSKMNTYLRPSTLFGPRFSEYLQEQSGEDLKQKSEDKLEAIFN